MRVLLLKPEVPGDYSCQAYWIRGESPAGLNTLVDTGSGHPESIRRLLELLEAQSKGIGRRAVEQILITHEHSDHAGGAPALADHFGCPVLAWAPVPGRSAPLVDGQSLRVGDLDIRVVHTPGHSPDSTCFFEPRSGTLFSGDTLWRTHDATGRYPREFLRSLERLCALDVKAIYSGHAEPVTEEANAYIREIHARVLNSFEHP